MFWNLIILFRQDSSWSSPTDEHKIVKLESVLLRVGFFRFPHSELMAFIISAFWVPWFLDWNNRFSATTFWLDRVLLRCGVTVIYEPTADSRLGCFRLTRVKAPHSVEGKLCFGRWPEGWRRGSNPLEFSLVTFSGRSAFESKRIFALRGPRSCWTAAAPQISFFFLKVKRRMFLFLSEINRWLKRKPMETYPWHPYELADTSGVCKLGTSSVGLYQRCIFQDQLRIEKKKELYSISNIHFRTIKAQIAFLTSNK